MKCKNCGKMFKVSNVGRKPSFCSTRCRVEYNRNKKRFGETADSDRDKVRVEKQKIIVPVTKKVQAEINRVDFERMMGGSVEQELRFVKDVLHRAMISSETPMSALANIGRELVNVSRQLDEIVTSGTGVLNTEEDEVMNDDDINFDTSLI